MIISLTVFKVRSLWYLPRFLWHASRSGRQIQQSPGMMHYSIKADFRQLTFWTLSAWEGEPDLKRYVWNAAHWKAMKATQSMVDTMGSYRYLSNQIPDWEEAVETLEKHLQENLAMPSENKVLAEKRNLSRES